VALLSIIASVTGCGSSSGSAIDAAPAGIDASAAEPDASSDPFFCLGKPLPTSASPTVTLSGVAEEIANGATKGLSGASVKAFKTGSATSVAEATSGADGTFVLKVTTGGTPLDGYVVGHHDQGANNTKYLDTYLYPP